MDEYQVIEKFGGFPYSIVRDKNSNLYIASFKDYSGIEQKAKITEDECKAFCKFARKIKCQKNEFDRHIEHFEINENQLNKRAKEKPISLEDEFIRKSEFQDVRNAVEKLPKNQMRRIKKYFFEQKTQQEIADEEGVDIRAVQYTLSIALKNLRKILKKF